MQYFHDEKNLLCEKYSSIEMKKLYIKSFVHAACTVISRRETWTFHIRKIRKDRFMKFPIEI